MANFTRRNFLQHSALLAFLFPFFTTRAVANLPVSQMRLTQQWRLVPDGWIPNNTALPVLHFSLAENTTENQAQLLSDLGVAGWERQWQASPFSYLHFHSRTHVMFVVTAGNGQLRAGGENGKILQVRAGDMIFLPAGTGQQKLAGSDDFTVAACYPKNSSWDVCRTAINPETVMKKDNNRINSRTQNMLKQLGAVI